MSAVILSLIKVFHGIVLPILLLAALGWLIRRRLGLDMPTLTRLNFYLVVPAIIYYSLVTAPIAAGEMLLAIAFTLAMTILLSLLTRLLCRLRRVPADHRNAVVMSVTFFNSGNYGLPLQDFAFRSAGLSAQASAIQVFVMVTQNLLTFTYGFYLAATGRGTHTLCSLARRMLLSPPILAIAAAALTVQARRLPAAWTGPLLPVVQPFWDALLHVKNAFIAVALCTLGAQLAGLFRDPTRYPVKMAVFLRLLAAPALGLALILLLGLKGLPAQALLISTATPTAVNCMLLCLEFDNHPNFAAKAVFYSTLLSPLTVTLVIALAFSGVLQP